MEDLLRAVDEHVALFNASVLTGDWSPFVATLHDDAQMRFVDLPVGPYQGRAAIATAYAKQPPDDTITVTAVEPVGEDAARVLFSWDRGGGDGTMTIRWWGGQVADLTIAFH